VLGVAPDGTGSLSFLDGAGAVAHSIP
jgi:hypothetical protein